MTVPSTEMSFATHDNDRQQDAWISQLTHLTLGETKVYTSQLTSHVGEKTSTA